MDLFKQLFLIKPVKEIFFSHHGQILKIKLKGDKYFSQQIELHTAKLYLSIVLKCFWGNSKRTSPFSQKRDYLRKRHRNTQKVFFFTKS